MGTNTPLQRRGEMKHAGWFQNDTYAVVRPLRVHVCRVHHPHVPISHAKDMPE